jgi:acetoin utilization deacetylase AcuC-like enzyme
VILERLEQTGLLERLLRLEPAEAPRDALGRVHDPDYVGRIEAHCREGGMFAEDSDTVGSPGTWRAAVLSAGAVVTAADAVMAGTVANAFCCVRPPGHHAERDHAMGFCFFNNVAVGVRHVQARHGIERVAVVDWDVHHGNGTQHAFESDPSVFYFSIHQYPHYPGTGRRAEDGVGDGRGFTLNVPLAAGATDADYGRAFREELRPALDRFRPQFVFISAGFDGHRADPLGGMGLTADGFADLTREVLALAEAHAAGRLVSVLEGGYNLAALAASVEAHLRALMGP